MISSNCSFVVGNVSYSSISANNIDSDSTYFSATSGEIVNIVESPTWNHEETKMSATLPSNTTMTSSTKSERKTRADKVATSTSKVRQQSIADIDKRRKELVKITRQKYNGQRSVGLTLNGGRILKRLTDSKKGGVALLLGSVESVQPGQVTYATSGSVNAAMTVEKMKQLQKQAQKKASKRGDLASECTEIYAVCEICELPTFQPSSPLLSTLPTVSHVCNMAKSLGLQIVGCAVSTGSAVEDSKKNKVWSPDHIFSALQLMNTSFNASEFIILSVSSNTLDESTKGGKPISIKGTKKIKSTSMMKGLGIVTEAFQLSDQAHLLAKRGILPHYRIDGSPSTTTPSSSGKDKKKGKGQQMDSNNKEDDIEGEKIQLNGAVLTMSDESSSLDPYLLAVPIPMVSLKSNVHSKTATKGSKQCTAHMNARSFEHSFPTPEELASSADTLKRARAHLFRTLSSLNNPDVKDRLRDPHLLLYMCSTNIVDRNSFNALCKSLTDGSPTIAVGVKMALEMARVSLGDGGRGRGSAGRKDDEEDDE